MKHIMPCGYISRKVFFKHALRNNVSETEQSGYLSIFIQLNSGRRMLL